MFKGTMTNWPVQKQTRGTAQNTQNNKTYKTFKIKYVCVFWVSQLLLFFFKIA